MRFQHRNASEWKIWHLVRKRLDQKRHAVSKSQHSRKDFEAHMRQGKARLQHIPPEFFVPTSQANQNPSAPTGLYAPISGQAKGARRGDPISTANRCLAKLIILWLSLTLAS